MGDRPEIVSGMAYNWVENSPWPEGLAPSWLWLYVQPMTRKPAAESWLPAYIGGWYKIWWLGEGGFVCQIEPYMYVNVTVYPTDWPGVNRVELKMEDETNRIYIFGGSPELHYFTLEFTRFEATVRYDCTSLTLFPQGNDVVTPGSWFAADLVGVPKNAPYFAEALPCKIADMKVRYACHRDGTNVKVYVNPES